METDNLIIVDSPYIRTYKNGRVERLLTSTFVPASEDPAAGHGVATRDVVIHQDTGLSVRLFLPLQAAAAGRSLPLVIYVHGGFFCTESAFCRTYHRYATSLAASSGALVLSVEYRLAPEHPVPAAYDDAWDALRWASLLSDPWIGAHADPQRTFLAGDSAGGNIVYHTAVRAAREGGVLDVLGLIMVQPYFWGPKWLPSEMAWDGVAMFPAEHVDKLWPFVTGYQSGNDDNRINPPKEEIASLTCSRVLVAVAQKDTLVDRGRALAAHMRENPWIGDNVTLVESEDEDHGFHLYRPLRASSKRLMKAVVEFINQPDAITTPPTAAALLDKPGCYTLHEFQGKTKKLCWGLSVPTRPFHFIRAGVLDMEIGRGGISSMASNSLKTIWHGKTRTHKTHYMNPLSSATIQGCSAMKNFF
ncbi:unnamed protein product [Alopecurus aequalis]